MKSIVEVKLWGTTVGYLGYIEEDSSVASFSYSPEFYDTPIGISPLTMKNFSNDNLFRFDEISFRTFKGLPGLFADSLPDKFGSQLIDQFMAKKHIPKERITALDRLLYIGNRAMGAIEYHPFELDSNTSEQIALDITALSELAEMVVSRSDRLQKELSNSKTKETALSLIRVGSSAGGARSKALVAEKEDGKLYDGTLLHDEPCSYWLLKFDSSNNSDRDHADPKGMTKIEYIYAIIARECGIDMPKTKFIKSGDDFHFMIERFDRIYKDGKSDKLHYASWAGLTHSDRDTTGAYSYEQLVMAAREIGLAQDAVTEIFKRALFNVVGRNQDDHTKNFGFLMSKKGEWSLSPAFDMTYSYDPTGMWTRVHQIKLNGKQDGFAIKDIVEFGEYCNLDKKKSLEILEHTQKCFADFGKLAIEYDVENNLRTTVIKALEERAIGLSDKIRERRPKMFKRGSSPSF